MSRVWRTLCVISLLVSCTYTYTARPLNYRKQDALDVIRRLLASGLYRHDIQVDDYGLSYAETTPGQKCAVASKPETCVANNHKFSVEMRFSDIESVYVEESMYLSFLIRKVVVAELKDGEKRQVAGFDKLEQARDFADALSSIVRN